MTVDFKVTRDGRAVPFTYDLAGHAAYTSYHTALGDYDVVQWLNLPWLEYHAWCEAARAARAVKE